MLLDVDNLATNLAACHFLDEHGSKLEVIDHVVGVDAALKAERRVGVQRKAAGALANPCGMEVGRLEEDVGSRLGHTTVKAAKHAANAHGVLGVANHQVAVGERALHAVEGDKFSAWLAGAHHNLVALDLAQVEAMQWLVGAKQDIVGYVDYIVDGTLAHGGEEVLQPLWALAHLHVANGQAAVAGACLAVLHLNGDAAVGAVDLEAVYAGAAQIAVLAVALEPGVEVARHTIVRAAINAVRGEVHLYEPVALDAIVGGGGSAHHGVVGQDDDAGMVAAYAYLILGAYHAEGVGATQFRLLDYKFLVAVVEHSAHGSHYHLLARCHIGGAAHDLHWLLAVAQVHGGEVQVVTVGVRLASEHLAHYQAFESATNCLYFLDGAHLKSERCQRVTHLLSSEVEVKVLFQPF